MRLVRVMKAEVPLKPNQIINMKAKNTNPLMIDAECEITGLPQDLFPLQFDKQGQVEWKKELFATQVHQPATPNGVEVLKGLQREGKRPLNGHFAIWLNAHKDQIPDEWKEWEMLFMGTVISHESFIYHEGALPERTCLKLWFQNGWKIEPVNFSSSSLGPKHRIPLLPT
jgi:hypothetical protein